MKPPVSFVLPSPVFLPFLLFLTPLPPRPRGSFPGVVPCALFSVLPFSPILCFLFPRVALLLLNIRGNKGKKEKRKKKKEKLCSRDKGVAGK